MKSRAGLTIPTFSLQRLPDSITKTNLILHLGVHSTSLLEPKNTSGTNFRSLKNLVRVFRMRELLPNSLPVAATQAERLPVLMI